MKTIIALLLVMTLQVRAGLIEVTGVYPEQQTHLSNCLAIGSSKLDAQTFSALQRQARVYRAYGITPLIYAWWPMAGPNIGAASNAMIVPAGVQPALSPIAVVAGDYNPTNGYKGDGSTKYWKTGFNPVAVGCSSTNLSLTLSIWNTNINGTSKWYFGNAGSGADQTGLAYLNGGTIFTGLIGFSGAGASEYPGAYFAGSTSNMQTGVFSVKVKAMPLMLGTATASTNIPLNSAISLQGLANTQGEDYYYAIQNDRIVKVRWSDNAAVLTNASAATFGTTNWDHFGDGIVLTYNGLNSGTGKLLVPAESVGGSFPTATVSNAYFLGFNTNTLALEDVYCVTNIFTNNIGVGACVMQTNGVMLVMPGFPYYQTNLYYMTPPPNITLLSNSCYDIAFGNTVNVILQGCEQTNGLLVLAQGAVGSGTSKVQIYVADPSTSPVRCEMVREYTSLANEVEGVMWAKGRFVCGAIISSVMYNLWFTAPTFAASTTVHSPERWLDGKAQWIPGNTLGNLANNEFYYGAVNNNGTVSSACTNSIGQQLVMQGFADPGLWWISQREAVAVDFALGRRATP